MGDHVIMQAAYRVAYDVSVPSPADNGRAANRDGDQLRQLRHGGKGDRVRYSVPSPRDGVANVPWWWDHIASQAQEWAEVGFTEVLGPPLIKTASGDFPDADGYGPYDDYDIGSKITSGALETRFGSREQLARCVAIMKANGLSFFADTVPHQRSGGRDGTYEYASATGKTNGRFGKIPSYFVGSPPRVPRDPIAGPISDDFAFGDELAPVNAKPKGAVMIGLIDAGDWLFSSLGIEGARIDDVKGMAVEFVRTWANAKSMAGKFMVAEYYDGNPATLNWWVWESGMEGRVSVFDFTCHFAVEAMCNNNSNFDMQQLKRNGGFFQWSPVGSVTFVENPDTDTDGFATVIWNKVLGYAFILTSEGVPCVYYKDYSTDEGCYGLKPWIDNLVWINRKLANGSTILRYADYQTYVYERQGSPGLLVGLNNDQYNAYERYVQTQFKPGTWLHDYSGHGPDLTVDENGCVTISLQRNINGQNCYVCYAPGGIPGDIPLAPAPITQKFYGDVDLDIGPVVDGNNIVGRIWCEAGTNVALVVDADIASLASQNVAASLRGPSGEAVPFNDLAVRGWYEIVLVAEGLPADGVGLVVTATYQAPKVLAS
jgi:alpha-amylase